MTKRYFLQKCHKYEPKKQRINQCFLSEKLDGVRCFWDGGITRGLKATDVPWANTAKHGRFINPPLATGLWSGYAQPIQAPSWFLDMLPRCPLDGELYAGRRNFQFAISVVRCLEPDERWKGIRFGVFDSPSLGTVLANGEISNPPHYVKTLTNCVNWVQARGATVTEPRSFRGTLHFLVREIQESNNLYVVRQVELPTMTQAANDVFEEEFNRIIEGGGEGVVIRNPNMAWTPERTHFCLKYKPFDDAEGVVTGYTWGKETDKGSRHLGRMGALILSFKGKRFELSGFTDEERRLVGPDNMMDIAIRDQGKDVSDLRINNPMFPKGAIVTFKYRELTNEGIPKEARYFRKRESV